MRVGSTLQRNLSGLCRPAMQLAAMAVVASIAQLISIQLWMPAPRDHMLWLPGAALLCALLWRPYAEWFACLLGALLGCVGTLVAFGALVAETSGVIAGLLVLVALAAWVMRRLRGHGPPLEDYRQVVLFLLVAVLALPLASATWTALSSRNSNLAEFVGPWHNLLLAHALSYLVLVPTFVALGRVRVDSGRRLQRAAPRAAFGLAMLAALWTAWLWPWSSPVMQPLLILAATMFLAWTLLVFGAAGALLVLLCSTLPCMLVSSRGLGPLALDSLAQTTLAVQLWALGNGVLLLLLAVLAEQRRTARVSLQVAYLQLADLTGRMLRVQEEERTRIARDLHDDINQSLASISIQMSSLKRATEPAARDRIEKLQEQLLAVSGDVRRLSHDLHPSLLRYTSLAAALRSLCESCHCPDGTQLHCDVADGLALDENQKLNLFRIAQEAIHNVNRHARARHAWLRLDTDAGEGVLQVEDDGIGIDDADASARRGLGLISIEERARVLGGSARFEQRREGGSRLQVRFPVARST